MERKEYTRYSREFKLEAVRLAALGERLKAQIARELDQLCEMRGDERLDHHQEPARTRVTDHRERVW